MSVTIYHNPRCSKSRQTLQIIRDKGIEPQTIEYLKTPPSAEALKSILQKLGVSARDLMRKGESVYKQKKLDDPDLSEDALIAAMAEDPILIERPIVLVSGKAVIGRPPERVLSIL